MCFFLSLFDWKLTLKYSFHFIYFYFFKMLSLVCNLPRSGETGSAYDVKRNVFVSQPLSLLCGDERCAVQGSTARDGGCA